MHNNIVKANEFNEAACEAAVKIGDVFSEGPGHGPGRGKRLDASHLSEITKEARLRYRKIASVKEGRFERSSYGIGGPPPPPPPPPS